MKWKLLLIVLGVVVFGYWLWTQVQEQSISPKNISTRSKTIKVASALAPLSMIAEEVGAGYVEATSIVPPGVSPHDFEPTPQDVAALSTVDVVFIAGYGLDNWILQYVPKEVKVVNVSRDVHLITMEGKRLQGHVVKDMFAAEQRLNDERSTKPSVANIDPHYWLAPLNGQPIAGQIRDALVEQDPDHTLAFDQAYYRFVQQIDEALTDYDHVFNEYKDKQLVTTHDAFTYLARSLSATVAATLEPPTGEEPSPQYIANVVATIQKHNIPVIFTEPQSSDENAQRLADEYQLMLVELDDLGGVEGRLSYAELLKFNLEQLSKALTFEQGTNGARQD